MVRSEIYDRLKKSATKAYSDEHEAKAVIRYITENLLGFQFVSYFSEPERDIFDITENIVLDICGQIEAHRPVQYITGRGWFMGYELCLQESVLIPRPETEELVGWVEEFMENRRTNTILDVGTGSGAIAIALAGKLNGGGNVCGIDKSTEALEIARKNARRNGLEIDFIEVDVLKPADEVAFLLSSGQYDIIVSNPPYIPAADLASIDDNVRLHEPHQALFVPDDDVLVFYRAIGKLGLKILNTGGGLFFECYSDNVNDVADTLSAMGYGAVESRNDMFGKPRMVRAVKQ